MVNFDVLMDASREPSSVDSVNWEDGVRNTFMRFMRAGAQWKYAPVASSLSAPDLLSLEAGSQVWSKCLGRQHRGSPAVVVPEKVVPEGKRKWVCARVPLKSVKDITEYDASGSTSSEWCYDDLKELVKLNSYILGGENSQRFDLETQSLFCRYLSFMSADDPCDLVHAVRGYYSSFARSQSELLILLEQFCAEHPEVLNSPAYADTMSWTAQDG